jgi:membrane protease YdiL (CAAX protease family)
MVKSKNNLRHFFLLTIGFSWIFWLLVIFINRNYPELMFLKEVLDNFAVFVPSIMGIFYVYLETGKEGMLKLLIKGLKYKFELKYYLYLLIMPAILSVTFVLSKMFFTINIEMSLFENPKLIPLVFIYIFFLGGPLGEEFGWRGYALPKLNMIFKPLYSSLILGIIWSIWHLPLFYMQDTVQSDINFLGYTLFTILITVIITIIFIKSGGSILAAILFHTLNNLSWGVFPLFYQTGPAVIVLILLILTTGFLVYKNRDIMI